MADTGYTRCIQAQFLRRYQQWRKGEIDQWEPDSHAGPDPRRVSEAIDAAIFALDATPLPADAALADLLKVVESQLGHAADVGATYVAFTREETMRIAAALRARPQAVAEVPLSALVCVGRARFPRTGGNAGISWHVEDALSDMGGFRSGSPCNGELLFVLPTTAKRAMLAASQSATGAK